MPAWLAGPRDDDVVEFMTSCNPRGPLVVHIAKLFPKQDCSRFDALGRILSGTLRPGDRVKVRWDSAHTNHTEGGRATLCHRQQHRQQYPWQRQRKSCSRAWA